MSATTVPVRALTREPGSHWFGYYDKLNFDPADRLVLAMRTEVTDRTPHPTDRLDIGLIDLEENDRWTSIGSSTAWGWQQGCMLQWVPGTTSTVIWNDREQDRFVSRLQDVTTGDVRTIPHPVYALFPDGKRAVSADFRRINDTRPGYGYCGLPDPYADERAPETSGIWTLDLETGAASLIVSLAQVMDIPSEAVVSSTCKHWFNHLLVSPGGSRIEFLHRWSDGQWDGRSTRMFTCKPDGSDLRVAHAGPSVSHFIWTDPTHIALFSNTPDEAGFYLVDVMTGRRELVYACPDDGHLTYLPGNDWILNDAYGGGTPPVRPLYLWHVPSGTRHDLGRIPDRKVTNREWRCDLHPRANRAGTAITFDSFWGGTHRQIYYADLRGITG